MKKNRYLITGATGVIGSSLVKRLACEKNELVCPIRNKQKVHSIFNDNIQVLVDWVEAPIESILKDNTISFDYIIHCASPTASLYFVEHPVETMRFNTETTVALLDYAVNKGIKGMVFLSSLESYGTVLDDRVPLDEDFQGYVNPMSTRSSYNMAKRMCECFCHAYAVEYGVPVKVVRLTQTISPLVDQNDKRVYAQFAQQAALGKDIVLHTEGLSARQYIYIDDAVDAILCVLYKGESGVVYNAAREDSYITIREMAEFIQDNFNKSGKVVVAPRSDMGYAPITKLRLSTKKLQSLGWHPNWGLYDMFDKLISTLRNNHQDCIS